MQIRVGGVFWQECYTEYHQRGNVKTRYPQTNMEGVEMKQLKSNRGFSLVEMIIVIAILALTVSILAPQLLKYIEKAKVSSDTQLCDTLHSAITYALMDPEVLTANDYSKKWIEEFTATSNGFGGPMDIKLYPGAYGGQWLNCKFVETVTEIAGYNPWTTPLTEQKFQSTPEDGYFLMPCAVVSETGNGFAVYLAHSDRTGHKQGENFNDTYEELENSKVIYVK